MVGIKIEVTGNIARVTQKPKYITSGTVGLPVEFTFSDGWNGLEKTAVFQAGHVCKIVSGLGVSTTVPWEVLQNAHKWLSIGMYGENADGSVAIPTIWANVKVIDVGTSPNGDSCNAPAKAEWTRMLIGQSAYELAVALGFAGSEEEWIASLKGDKGDSFTYEDFTPEQLEKLAEEAAKIVEAGISVIVCLDEGDQATHTAPEIYNAILEKKAVVYHHTDRTTNEFISLKEASPSKAVFSKTGYPTGFDIFNIEIDANGTVSYETFLSADLVTQVVEKGEGVDSIVQVITTESGSEELDNKPVATGDAALALGKFCVAEGDSSAAVNYYNRVYGDRAFACGWGNELHGYCAFGTGANNAVPESGKCGSVFGANNTVSGEYAAAFGVQNVASGENALAAGQKVTASGKNAVAVGKETTASGENAVAGGYLSKATGNYALALGHTCEASAPASVAMGNRAKATAAYARALGVDVEASGAYSVACGQGVMARGKAQVVLGTFNTANSDARFIVGNGTADDARGNAFEIYDGKLVLGGKALLASDIERLTECTTRTAWDLDDIKSFIVQEIQSGGLCEQPKTLLVHNFSSGYVIFGKSYAIVELRAIPQSPSLSDAGHAYVVADIYTGSNSYKMYADYNPSEDLILYPPTFYGPYAVATQEYVQMYVAGLGLEDGKDGADGKDGVGIVSVTIEEVA